MRERKTQICMDIYAYALLIFLLSFGGATTLKVEVELEAERLVLV